jgi:hypothetical protein
MQVKIASDIFHTRMFWTAQKRKHKNIDEKETENKCLKRCAHNRP